MKYFVITLLLLSVTIPAFAELTSDDLLKISEIVNKSIKESETRMKEYIDIKIQNVNTRIDSLEKNVDDQFKSIDKRFDSIDKRFDSFDKSLDRQANLTYALIALIAIVIIPQYIYLFRNGKINQKDALYQELRAEIESLKQHIQEL